jgi:hypothetical protein
MPSASLSSLEAKIQQLAAAFSREVVAALRALPLSEIAEFANGVAVVGAGKATSIGLRRRKRRVVNYPKCAWAGCGKNRSPRTIPYCGEHFRAVRAGDTPPPGSLGTGVPVTVASGSKRPRKGSKRARKGRAA